MAGESRHGLSQAAVTSGARRVCGGGPKILRRPLLVFLPVLLAAIVFAAASAAVASAADVTWTGGSLVDSKWSTTANWDGQVAPGPPPYSVLLFSGTTRQANVNDLVNLALSAIDITTSGFSISGNLVYLPGDMSATLGSGGTATWGLNTLLLNSARTFTVGSGTLTCSGVLTGGGSITKAGAGTLVLSGASPSSPDYFVVSAGTLSLAGALRSGTTATAASGATLKVAATVTPAIPVTVDSGGTLAGTGPYGTVALSGTVSPGSSPGILASGTQTWAGGAGYVADFLNAAGAAGTDWDLVDITGDLTVNATSLSPFTVTLEGTLTGIDTSTQNYRWQIAKCSGTMSAFDVSKFTLVNHITTPLGTGQLGLEASAGGKGIDLVFYGPTAATISDFRASARGGAVTASWRSTAAGLLGFRLYRQDASGRLTRVGPALIPARYASAGAAATYSCRDPKARPGQKLTYALLAVGFDGSRQRFGPFVVRAGSAAAGASGAARSYASLAR